MSATNDLRIEAAASTSTQDRLSRLALLVVLQCLDVLTTAFQSASCASPSSDPSWWYPVAGRVTLVVVVWAIVLRLPVGARHSARLVQGMSVLVAASVAWNAVLLSSC